MFTAEGHSDVNCPLLLTRYTFSVSLSSSFVYVILIFRDIVDGDDCSICLVFEFKRFFLSVKNSSNFASCKMIQGQIEST